ncbi:hypothetical protein INT47_006894 [Mucor saturninus]|uniref:Uncharacterized protein n=1 Tax=Mucor saturninus TaxID=64648 RepID=A0A8H7R9X9_9FUNG|nr:hypothetical protein INT47_006894 [Mucor saturninus]
MTLITIQSWADMSRPAILDTANNQCATRNVIVSCFSKDLMVSTDRNGKANLEITGIINTIKVIKKSTTQNPVLIISRITVNQGMARFFGILNNV